ncbi:MAG: L-2-amino-thiazoline-4-carboxylic acid hydrolase [Christensenellales bacterium]|jgi:hypothetical protein
MHRYQKTRIAMLGAGFLLEYLFPCVTHLTGKENLSDCVIGTTADIPAIPAKQERLGVRIWDSSRNMQMLETLEPDIILFAPQPTFAPGVTREILAPYYESLRGAGKPLPDLYAFPPSPAGQFYKQVLGDDILVVNLLPNMVTSFAGIDVSRQGVTEITFPDGDVWPEEKEDRLREFFSPYGACVNTPPSVVFAYLGGQCTLHTVSELVYTAATALSRAGLSISSFQVASAMRAAYRAQTGYDDYPVVTPCSLSDVPEFLQEPLSQVIMAFYGGVRDACGELGMDDRLIAELFLNYLDLHLHSLQHYTREQIEESTFQHATKGGVTEMALRMFYRRIDYPLSRLFAQPQEASLLLEEIVPLIRSGARESTHVVTGHGANLDGNTVGALEVEHHAHLYAMLAAAAFNHLGDEADALIEKATRRYGRQRGERMRLRALKYGIPLDMAGFYALKEWQAGLDDFVGAHISSDPYDISEQYLCPWNQTWKCFAKQKEGRLYCRYVDHAVLNGFNPALRLQMPATLSAGDLKCEFHFMDATSGQAERQRIDSYVRKVDADALRPFSYHTAHLLTAFKEVFEEEAGERGRAAVDEAVAAFRDQYRNGAWELLEPELSCDFSAI